MIIKVNKIMSSIEELLENLSETDSQTEYYRVNDNGNIFIQMEKDVPAYWIIIIKKYINKFYCSTCNEFLLKYTSSNSNLCDSIY